MINHLTTSVLHCRFICCSKLFVFFHWKRMNILFANTVTFHTQQKHYITDLLSILIMFEFISVNQRIGRLSFHEADSRAMRFTIDMHALHCWIENLIWNSSADYEWFLCEWNKSNLRSKPQFASDRKISFAFINSISIEHLTFDGEAEGVEQWKSIKWALRTAHMMDVCVFVFATIDRK